MLGTPAALGMSCELGSRPTRRIGVWGTQQTNSLAKKVTGSQDDSESACGSKVRRRATADPSHALGMTTIREWRKKDEERSFAALRMTCGLGSRPTRKIGVWGTQQTNSLA